MSHVEKRNEGFPVGAQAKLKEQKQRAEALSPLLFAVFRRVLTV